MSARPHTFAADCREVFRLALPIVAVQVGVMAMGVVDTLIVGHVSAVALAAATIGHLYFFWVLVLGMGVLFALDPLVSQGLGAGDDRQVTLAIQRALVIAVGLSAVATLIYLPAETVIRWLGQPAEVVPSAAAFVHASIPGALPVLAFVVFRQSLQAMRRMRPIVVTIIAANVVNAALGVTLVYGHLGAPRLGVVGAAWSGTISRWFMVIALVVLAWRELEPRVVPWRRETLDGLAIRRMLAMGFPIGVQMSLEFGVFGVVALLMGRLGTVAVAGHQIAINLASFTFMVPLGVGSAAAVLVGHAIGRGDPAGARRVAWASMAIAIGFMALSALTFVTIPRVLARMYTPVPEVIDVAVALLPIAGVFQIFDGTQVSSLGVLRGTGDTRAPMLINVLGFWLIGLPVSLLLAFRWGFGPAGLWWGFVAGLGAVAILLVLRVRARLRSSLVRVAIERPTQTAEG